jgi:nucleotide-binding universal stress UspA family protein
MRIAVATDFSEQAQRAGEAGAALAKKLGAAMVMVHAIAPAPPEGQADSDGGRSQLAAVAESMRGLGLRVEVEEARGYAEEAIAAAASRLGARLLVIGTHGRRAPLRWILGSVAERTLQASEVPVLVVGDDAQALVDWAAGARPLRVTVALESATPTDPLVELARLFHAAGACTLTFVHVASRALLEGPLPGLLARSLRAKLAGLGADLQLIPDGAGVAPALARFLDDHPCDLMLVGVHSRSGVDFPRTAEVARSLLHRRMGPVLGIPLADAESRAAEQPSIQSILAPTDLSALGDRAVAYAFAMAPPGASITLLHVHDPGAAPAPLDDEVRLDLELRLCSLIPPDARARQLATQILVVAGSVPARAIIDTATRLGCDIVCMGSHGRSALGRMVLGSVADEVVHGFPKPVLIVR